MRRTCPFPLGLAFFGLTPKYRNILFTQIHDLVYHGGGGFKHTEVYNMPTWLRLFHINKINEYNEKQNEEYKRATNQPSDDSKIHKPNIKPSSTYNL